MFITCLPTYVKPINIMEALTPHTLGTFQPPLMNLYFLIMKSALILHSEVKVKKVSLHKTARFTQDLRKDSKCSPQR